MRPVDVGPWTPASEGRGPLQPCQGVPVTDSPDIDGPGVCQLKEFWHNTKERESKKKKWRSVCVGWGLRRGVDRTWMCVWECMSESLVEQKMERPAITSIVTCLHANLTLEWALQSVNPFVILLLNHLRLMLPSYSCSPSLLKSLSC